MKLKVVKCNSAAQNNLKVDYNKPDHVFAKQGQNLASSVVGSSSLSTL